MRVYDNGSGATVTVSRREVEQFNRSWPCSSLPARAITFAFDNNGDLVEILPYSISDKVDGPEAVALSTDAQNYAAMKLNRPSLAR